jgi:hypothetical protein
MNTNYAYTIIFTKRTDLMPWFKGRYSNMSDEYINSVSFNQFKKDCARIRDIKLILLVRYEPGHTYCKIKCPVNPLPIKGEFEAVSLKHIVKLLQREGWSIESELSISLLK